MTDTQDREAVERAALGIAESQACGSCAGETQCRQCLADADAALSAAGWDELVASRDWWKARHWEDMRRVQAERDRLRAQVKRAREVAREHILANERHVAQGGEHRPCESGARAALGRHVLALLDETGQPGEGHEPDLSDGAPDSDGKGLPAGLCYRCQRPADAHRPAPVVPDSAGLRERVDKAIEDVLCEHRIVTLHGQPGERYRCEASGCDYDTEDWTAWEEHVAPFVRAAVLAAVTVEQVNRLLGVSLWDVSSFCADARIDFHEDALDDVLAVVGQGVTAEQAWREGFDLGTAHGIAYQAGDDEAWLTPPNPYRTRPSGQEPTTRGAGA